MTTSPSENETLNLNVEDHSTVHRYTLDDEEICAIFSRPIYRKIIASPAFQRLKKIRFLGAIDYVLNPDKPSNMHCRYQHSLGVAKLALQYAKSLDFSDDLEMLCVVAALLHDIGHAPLSHSLEPMFQELHDMNHHKAGETILLGDVRVGSKLWKTLTEAESGAFRLFSVMALIEGHGPTSSTSFLFKNPINVDTVEGICRSRTYYLGTQLSDFRPDDVIESLARIQKGKHSIKDVHLLDKFWRLKQEVYSVLINSTIGTYSDYICHDYLFRNKNKVNAQSFFASESEFKKQNSALFTTLKNLRHSLDNPTKLPQIPSKRERRYFINDVEIATPENVFERYVSSKTTIEKEKDHGQQHTLEVSSYKLSQKLF